MLIHIIFFKKLSKEKRLKEYAEFQWRQNLVLNKTLPFYVFYNAHRIKS